ncbi:MAG: zinc-ribbon domain-containing protein [Nitrospinae bacterium]|nr:zinc-ribbon domain-containing protein [Nitrospinota bacterium]
MEVTCPSCAKTTNVPDEKIPKGQAFGFSCPSCRTKIRVNPDGSTSAALSGETFGADADKPGAMVCHGEPAKYKALLESMGFVVHAPADNEQAIQNIRLNNYKFVLVGAEFASSGGDAGVLQHLQEMNMASRRRMFVAYVVQGASSYDNMEAFAKSVNLIVSPQDAAKDNFRDHLLREMRANDSFYKVFFEVMSEIGKL